MKNALIVFLSLVWTWQAFAQDFGGIISPIPCAQSPALPNAGDLGCAYVAVPDTQGGVPATWFVPPGEEIDDFFVTTTLMGIKSTQYWSDWTSRFFTVIEIDTVEYADASGFTSLAVFDCAEWDMYYTVWGTAAGRDGGDPWDFLGPYKHLSNSLGQWKPNAMCVPSNNEDYDEATTGTFGEPDWTAGIFDLGICFGVDVDQDNQEDCVVVISGNPNPSSDGPNATAEGEIWHECGNGCTEQERVDEITSVLGPIISAALQSKAFADIFGDNDDWNPLYTYAVNFRNVVGDTITYDRTTFEIEMYKDANGNRTFGVGNFEHNDEVYSYTVPNVPSTPDWSLFHFVWCHAPSCAEWDFSWPGVSWANEYEVWRSLNGQFGTYTLQYTTTVPYVSAHAGDENMWWKVRGKNSNGYGNFSIAKRTRIECEAGGGPGY